MRFGEIYFASCIVYLAIEMAAWKAGPRHDSDCASKEPGQPDWKPPVGLGRS